MTVTVAPISAMPVSVTVASAVGETTWSTVSTQTVSAMMVLYMVALTPASFVATTVNTLTPSARASSALNAPASSASVDADAVGDEISMADAGSAMPWTSMLSRLTVAPSAYITGSTGSMNSALNSSNTELTVNVDIAGSAQLPYMSAAST